MRNHDTLLRDSPGALIFSLLRLLSLNVGLCELSKVILKWLINMCIERLKDSYTTGGIMTITT